MASWEPRFVLGVEDICNANDIVAMSLLFSSEYRKHTLANVTLAEKALLNSHSSTYHCEVDFKDQISCFSRIEEHITKTISNGISGNDIKVLLDITTMPREIVWNCCRLLSDISADSEFVYYPPEKYHEEWLTNDADAPRLVLRSSGISRYGKPTALVIVTGYDAWRTSKAIVHYEPQCVRLGVQKGEQYGNIQRNAEEQKRLLKPQIDNITFFDFDSYKPSFGYELLSETVAILLPDYNVLLTSQGPKPSAIACFNVVTYCPKVGLFYVPSREYNLEYSSGIDLTAVVRRSINFALPQAQNSEMTQFS